MTDFLEQLNLECLRLSIQVNGSSSVDAVIEAATKMRAFVLKASATDFTATEASRIAGLTSSAFC